MSLLSKRAAMLALAVLPFVAGTALAQDSSTGEHSGRGERSRPCRADVEKFCSGVEHGGGRVFGCLKAHLADLAPECHEAIEAHEKAHPGADAPK